ncbi:MAG: flagellar hook protein FlgE [Nitrospirae bacterium]|nr:flagellar hook protein FlgE [Nitrospirota bacterium]
MISALYAALSGLNSNGASIGVSANNVSNLATAGFKGSRANFADTFNQSLNNVNASQVGSGSMVNSLQRQFTQGAIVSTGNPLDLAIGGNGFFIVKSPTQGLSYTRAGNFQVDSQGYVTTPEGGRLQGYAPGSTTPGDLNVGNLTTSAGATKNVALSMNLNSHSPVNSSPFAIVNGQPANYDYSATTTVYDSHGGAHDVTAYFSRTGTNTWDVNYASNSGPNSSMVQSAGKQTLTFDSIGTLTGNTAAPIRFDFGGGTAGPQDITFEYGNSGKTGNQSSGTTQLAADSQVTGATQDGTPPGNAKSVSIGQDGSITATFDNGQTTALGKVALADFANPGGLTSVGNNSFVQSASSGEPLVNQANSGGTGNILSGSLETSNVDLADQLVSMNISKTDFTANLATVRVAYEMMDEVLKLKS